MSAVSKAAANGRIDIDAHREKVAGVVDLEVGELTSAEDNGWQSIGAAIQRGQAAERSVRRHMAAYVLFRCDELPVRDIAEILQRTESQARFSIDWIARRVGSYAFKQKVDRAMAAYGSEAVDRARRRIAGVLGVTLAELVEVVDRDSEPELVQQVGAYLLVKDGLEIGVIAQVMFKNEVWVRIANEYVERHVSRERGLKDFVAKTSALYNAGRRAD
jgi:uncharacterized protein (DUF2164 family)